MQVGDVGTIELSTYKYCPFFRAQVIAITPGFITFDVFSEVRDHAGVMIFNKGYVDLDPYVFSSGHFTFTKDPGSAQSHNTLYVNLQVPLGLDKIPIEVIVKSGPDHSSCEVVDNVVMGKSFKYCRDHRVEV